MLIWVINQSDAAAVGNEFLERLLGKRPFQTVATAEEFVARSSEAEHADGLILVGDFADNLPLDPGSSASQALAGVFEFLTTTEQSVLALGFGFEVLCVAYGVNLREIGERGVGATKMEPTTEGSKLFQGSDPLCVAPNERWLTDEFPKKLQVLARSDTGVEAVKHKTRPLYGLQQRPEDFTYPSDAKMIYENIFSLFDQYHAKRA